MTFYTTTASLLNNAPDGLRLDQHLTQAPPQLIDEHSPEASLARSEHSMEEVNGVRSVPLSAGATVNVHNANGAATNGNTNGSVSSNGGNSNASSNKKRRRSNDHHPTHTRALAACEACRVSKTRCDSARPVCAKCSKRGLACVYPDKDPSSMSVEPKFPKRPFRLESLKSAAPRRHCRSNVY
jgi:hypothetical protein